MKKNSIDIQPNHLKLVINILRQHLPADATVWVFGSRAKGKAQKFSDLDLVIELNNSAISTQTIANLAFDFEESDLPYRVDIIDWSEIDDSFRSRIEADRLRIL